MYIILAPDKCTADIPCFWRADDCGYCHSPFVAGHYEEDVVKANPGYYNNGFNAVAIPLTDADMDKIGFKCSFDPTAIKHFLTKSSKT